MIFGQNETGKSTIKRCILALLFGQEEISDKKRNYNEYDLMKPWDKSPYKASMTYVLKNGRTFTISRDFENNNFKILDVGTGKDFTDSYPENEKGDSLFTKEHLGVNRSNFVSSSIIEPQQIHNDDDTEALSKSIMALADAATEDHTYLTVVNRLNTALEAIGTENDTSTPLGKVSSFLESLKECDSFSDKQKHLIEQMKEQIELLKIEKEQNLVSYKEHDYILKKIELNKLETVIKDLERLEREIFELESQLRGISGSDSVSLTSLTELYRLNTEREKTQQHLDKIEKLIKDASDDLKGYQMEIDLNKNILKAKEELLELINLTGNKEAISSVLQTKEKMLEQAKAREAIAAEQFEKERKIFSEFNNAEEYDMYVSELAVKLNKQELVKMKEMEVDRLDQELKDAKKSVFSRFIFSISVIAIGGFAGFFSLFPGIFSLDFSHSGRQQFGAFFGAAVTLVILGVFLLLFNTTRKTQETATRKYNNRKKELDLLGEEVITAQNELKVLFKKIGALSIDELRKRYREYTRCRIDLETATSLVKTLEEEVEHLYKDYQGSDALKSMLVEASFINESQELTGEMVRQFQNQYKHIKEVSTKVDQLNLELDKRNKEAEQLREEVMKIKIEIDTILRDGNVESIEEYDTSYRRIQQVDKLRAHLSSAREKRRILASGIKLADYKSKRKEIKEKIEQILSKNQELQDIPSPLPPLDTTQQEFNELLQNIREADARLSQLQNQLDEIESESVTDDKREEIIKARQTKNNLLKHKKALELAIDMITKTGKEFQERNLAPQLASTTAHLLNKITNKYNEVIIDKNMNILVKSSERNEFIKPEHLSRAALDQLYFALGFGIARTFATGKENLPLIMDDPFTNFDEERRKLAFQALVGVEKVHQIIFFTCSSLQKQDFARVLKDHNKLAKLSRYERLELIRPAPMKTGEAPPEPVQVRKQPAHTAFLTLPPGFELPK
jgi:DNA repair exonuclease SbcCD ATPase subunit